jgi:pimeloyl-ACP methyl ester carboxylesterase
LTFVLILFVGWLGSVDAIATTVELLPVFDGSIKDEGTPANPHDGIPDIIEDQSTINVGIDSINEYRGILEFNLASIGRNNVIKSAFLRLRFAGTYPELLGSTVSIQLFGYLGDGVFQLGDFDAGVFIMKFDVHLNLPSNPIFIDVTQFLQDKSDFVGFNLRWDPNQPLGAISFAPFIPSIFLPDAFPALVIELSPLPRIDIVASADRVWANGHEKTEITVTVLNAQGQGVAGRDIHLSADPVRGATISPPSGNATTDTSGKAYFTATSIKIGPVVFTATDAGNSTLKGSAQVEFVQRRVVVFVQGINTSLSPETEDNIFSALRGRLIALGFSRPVTGSVETGIACTIAADNDRDGIPNDGCPLILDYSYRGGLVFSATGIWEPFSYTCSDTANSLNASIEELGRLLLNFTTANPNTRFILIGHSQGGLIALQALRFAGVSGITIDTVITLDGALGGAPPFDSFIARALSCWGNPAARGMSQLWNSATDHNRQGTTAKFPGQSDNASLVQAAQSTGTQVITIGNRHDCVWNADACDWVGDNTSTQIVDTAAERYLLALGGTCLINPVFLPTVVEDCLRRTHSRVLDDSTVLHIIELAVGSPTVP